MNTETKSRNCPLCKEEIKADAIKCKHCGSAIAPEKPAHEGTCPYCKEEIHPEAIKCKHCESGLLSTSTVSNGDRRPNLITAFKAGMGIGLRLGFRGNAQVLSPSANCHLECFLKELSCDFDPASCTKEDIEEIEKCKTKCDKLGVAIF